MHNAAAKRREALVCVNTARPAAEMKMHIDKMRQMFYNKIWGTISTPLLF